MASVSTFQRDLPSWALSITGDRHAPEPRLSHEPHRYPEGCFRSLSPPSSSIVSNRSGVDTPDYRRHFGEFAVSGLLDNGTDRPYPSLRDSWCHPSGGACTSCCRRARGAPAWFLAVIRGCHTPTGP